jgi:excisionase family DNA binding protein
MTLLTPREAAARLNVDIRSIHNWIRSGRLRAVRLAGIWRIDETDLASALAGLPANTGPLPQAEDREDAATRFAREVDSYVRAVRQIRAAAQPLAVQTIIGPADDLLQALEDWAADYVERSVGR